MTTITILALFLQMPAFAAKPKLEEALKVTPAPAFEVLNKEMFLVWSNNEQYSAPDSLKPGPTELSQLLKQYPVLRTKVLHADKLNAQVEFQFDMGKFRNFFGLNKQKFWLPLSGLAFEGCRGDFCAGDMVEFGTEPGKKSKARVLGFNVFGDILSDTSSSTRWLNIQSSSGMRRVR